MAIGKAKDTRVPRATKPIKHSLERRLLTYAAAASAAGTGLVAASAASARIIYTPVNLTLTKGALPLDLDHDGIADFMIVDKSNPGTCCFYTQVLNINGNRNAGAGVVAQSRSAVALHAGAPIGPADPFENVQSAVARMATAFNDSNSFFLTYGAFANTANRFLGLKFEISGQTHYGWAALGFVRAGFHGSIPFITARLIGFAYEDVANQPIPAGRVSDGGASLRPAPASAPGTLGLLALGSPGLDFWRRRESAGGK